MTTWIQIDFYPDYMDKITSFHLIDDLTFSYLKDLKNDKDLFIENFYRVTKNCYKYLTNENLHITKLEDNVDLVSNYILNFGNNTDLLDLLKNYLNLDSECEFSISDDELTESFQINDFIKYNNENNEVKINELLKQNPKLKDELEDVKFD